MIGMVIADPEWLGKWEFEVRLYDTRADMQREAKVGKKSHAVTRFKRSGDVVLFFNRQDLELSLVAHEAVHACLWSMNRKRGKKRKHHQIPTLRHSEQLAERIGNLTSLIWYNLDRKTDDGI